MSKLIYEELLEGEELLWQGQPVLYPINKKLKPLLIGLLVILFMPALIIYIIEPFMVAIWLVSIFFGAIISIPMIFITEKRRYNRNLNTYYGITNKRIIKIMDYKDKNIEILRINGILNLNVIMKKNNTGNIIFGDSSVDFYGKYNALTFYDLENSEEVYALIKSLIK
ncbi:hypothetical protein [Anaeromicrobium sediminis]|uniref:DUF304 domain-containing protein n=1 Tax=Anaeromicrobium sediminis TaxID=1478221 RepID=A0A267MHP6_9FIRM|nr:hypothetical protein [Anaeromicrobium sediminis]PAB59101.1 hypothetical protein CCE28_11315 [Anaeromicrobium sediminis]